MEYAFEGDSLADEHQQQPSVFTSALVEGLTSGEADRDEDGLVSLNELYDYVYDRVRERNPKQTPGRDVELEGELYLARSNRRRLRPLPIPPDVAAALKSDNVFTRLGAVAELRSRLASPDLSAAFGAYRGTAGGVPLRHQVRAGSGVRGTGRRRLSPDPAGLHFGTVASRTFPSSGPSAWPARHSRGLSRWSQSEAWVTASVDPAEVHVSMTRSDGPSLRHPDTHGPTGEVVVPVTAEVVATSNRTCRSAGGQRAPCRARHPHRSAALPAEAAPTFPLPIEAARAAAPPPARLRPPPTALPPAAGDTPGPVTPATEESAQTPAGAEQETPALGPPAASAPTSGRTGS